MTTWFKPLTLARKLRLAIGLVAGLLAGLGLWQALSLRQSRAESLALFEHRLLPLQRLKVVSDSFHFEIVFAARQVRADTMTRAEGLLRIRQARREAQKAWLSYRQGEEFQAHRNQIADTQAKLDACQPVLDLLEQQVGGDASRLGRFLDVEVLPLFEAVAKGLNELSRLEEAGARAEVQAEAERVVRSERWAAVVLLGGFLLALMAGRRLAQELSGALDRVTVHLQRVARGDLAEALPIRSQDEMGALGEELNRMTARLRETLETLGAREATQRSLLQSAHTLIYTADVEGVIVSFNPKAEEMLGVRAADVVGQVSLEQFHDPIELALRTLDMNQALKLELEPGLETLVHGPRQGRVDQREWTFLHRNGTSFTGLMVLGPIQAEGGGLLGFSAIVTDTSQQREVEESHRRLRAILDLTPDAVAMAQLPVDHLGVVLGDPRVSYANKAFSTANPALETKGLDPQLLLNHLADWAVDQWREEGLPRLLSEGSWRGESALQGAMGLSVPVDLLLLAHRDELGRTTHVSSIARDIRREKSRERLLRERETRLQAINRASPVGIFITDTDGALSYVNPAFLTITGAKQDELAFHDWMEALHPDDVEVIRIAWDYLIEQRVPFETEGRFLRPDGSLTWANIQAAAVWDGDRFMGYVGCVMDTSELQAAQAELRQSEARAIAASRAKSQFLSSMSHELRTPLNAVLGYAQVMSRTPGRSAADHEHLERIHTAGEHLLGLINDVLSLSRIEAGGMTLQQAPFDTQKLFQTLRDLHALRATAKGLSFTVDVAPGFPLRLNGDEGKLRQVLVNLLGNAIKFTDEGFVRVRASYAAGTASFDVEDSGPGIPEAVQARLFETFYQTPENARAAEGAGLGLALSRAMVRLMGGDIRLRSGWGQGSTFTFSLPLLETAQEPASPARGRVVRLAPGQADFRMLVADDRFENRDLLCQLLDAVGFRSTPVADGDEAVAQWLSDPPDLVWMDLRMPRMDGFAALDEIRRQEVALGRNRTPIVAITASVLDLDRESLQARGFDDYLPKPFREEMLFEVLERMLGVTFAREAPEAVQEAPLTGLSAQPSDWKEAFREAVESGDTEAALALAEAVASPELSLTLRNHLKAYRFEELLANV